MPLAWLLTHVRALRRPTTPSRETDQGPPTPETVPSRAAEEPDQTSSRTSASDQVAATLARLWERFRDTNLDRVSALETTAAALLRGEPLDEQRRRAMERAAHGLAGSVGTYGFHEGSRLAREIEQLLGNGGALDRQARQLADLTAALRRELEATCRFS